MRSVDNVIEEIVNVTHRGWKIKRIAFHDEQFGANKNWVEEFLIKYKERVGLPFFVQMNPLNYKENKLRELKAVGLDATSFGMQSGSKRIRKIYNRPENLDDIKRANKILFDLKIPHFFDVIVDNPYENSKDLIATLNFLMTLKKPFVAKTFDLVHLPETNLTKSLLKDNLIDENSIEGNFENSKELSWRVRNSDVTLKVDDKFIVSLIQLTGNVFVSNVFIKFLLFAYLKGIIPIFFEEIIIKFVLSNWYASNIMNLNHAIGLVKNKGLLELIKRVVKKGIRSAKAAKS